MRCHVFFVQEERDALDCGVERSWDRSRGPAVQPQYNRSGCCDLSPHLDPRGLPLTPLCCLGLRARAYHPPASRIQGFRGPCQYLARRVGGSGLGAERLLKRWPENYSENMDVTSRMVPSMTAAGSEECFKEREP